MAQKHLFFSVYSLIVNDSDAYGLSAFSKIKPLIKEAQTIEQPNGVVDTLSFSTINKSEIDGRFLFFSITKGNKLPYPTMVTNPDLTEKKNPRSPEEMEPSLQWYALIDIKAKRIYLSDNRQKKEFENWIYEQTGNTAVIKAIVKKQEFVQKLKKINKLSFRLTPNLFSGAGDDPLENELTKTIYGFGAENAYLILQFHDKFALSDAFKKRLLGMTLSKEYEELSLIGVNDDNMESVLNVEEIISKISIFVPIGQYDQVAASDVSLFLTREILAHDR